MTDPAFARYDEWLQPPEPDERSMEEREDAWLDEGDRLYDERWDREMERGRDETDG